MSLKLIEDDRSHILELEVTGKFVTSDFQSLESTFQRFVKQYGKIRVLFRMQDFHGWEPTAFWDEVKFDLKHRRHGTLVQGRVRSILRCERRRWADGTAIIIVEPMFAVLVHGASRIEIRFLLKFLDSQIHPGSFARP
jgi:hypothetical protein